MNEKREWKKWTEDEFVLECVSFKCFFFLPKVYNNKNSERMMRLPMVVSIDGWNEKDVTTTEFNRRK